MYHINPENGNPGVCNANIKPCPYGETTLHYLTKENAVIAYERRMQAKLERQERERKAKKAVETGYMVSRYAGKQYDIPDAGKIPEKFEPFDPKTVDRLAKTLVANLSNEDGVFTPPSTSQWNPNFTYIDNGAEHIVYLHEKTQLVLKVGHNNEFSNKNYSEDVKYAQLLFESRAKALASLDTEKLDKLGVEYVPTIQHEVFDSENNPVYVTVQPYLDPDVYEPYEITTLDETILQDCGHLDDVRGNAFVNKETGRVILFDSLHCSLDD